MAILKSEHFLEKFFPITDSCIPPDTLIEIGARIQVYERGSFNPQFRLLLRMKSKTTGNVKEGFISCIHTVIYSGPAEKTLEKYTDPEIYLPSKREEWPPAKQVEHLSGEEHFWALCSLAEQISNEGLIGSLSMEWVDPRLRGQFLRLLLSLLPRSLNSRILHETLASLIEDAPKEWIRKASDLLWDQYGQYLNREGILQSLQDYPVLREVWAKHFSRGRVYMRTLAPYLGHFIYFTAIVLAIVRDYGRLPSSTGWAIIFFSSIMIITLLVRLGSNRGLSDLDLYRKIQELNEAPVDLCE